jgi:hypothetical protein
VIAFVIFASGLKYIGLSTTALGWTLFATLLLGGAFAVLKIRGGRELPIRRSNGAAERPLSDPLSNDPPATPAPLGRVADQADLPARHPSLTE